MSSEVRKSPLADAVERLGVELGSQAAVDRISQASMELASAVVPQMTAQCRGFIGRIEDDTWKLLFTTLPEEEKREVLKRLRLPVESWRKWTPPQQAHLVMKLRTGLNAWKDAGVKAAHDLTRPIRAVLVESARAGTTWQGDVAITAIARAAAVALCPREGTPFLPVVLRWMREHDEAAFDLLLPDDTGEAALRRFWDEFGSARSDDVEPEVQENIPSVERLAQLAHEAVEHAVVICRAILQDLERGLVPDQAALAELIGVRETVEATAAELADQLSSPVEPTLEAIDAAVRRIAHASDDVDLIRRLARADVPGSAAAALSVVAGIANGVLDRWPPGTEQDREDRDLLIALARLAVDASAEDIDDAVVETRYEQLRETAPKDLVPLLTAALRGRVTLPVTPSAVDDEHPPPIEETPSSTKSSAEGFLVETQTLVEAKPDDAPPAKVPAVNQEALGGLQAPPLDELPPVVAAPTPHRPARKTATSEKRAPRTDHLLPVARAKAVTWLDHKQFALVHHVLKPHEPALAEAAGLAALALSVTGPGDDHEPELDVFIRAQQSHLLVDGDAARLLTTCALVLAAVTTGAPGSGALLVELSDHLDTTTGVLARGIGEAVRRGVLASRGAAALAAASLDDLEVSAAAELVKERVNVPRRNRLPRAAAVVARLRTATAQSGEQPATLGDALHHAAADLREHVREVKAVLGKYSKDSVLERLIDSEDKAHRSPSGKAITGQVRQEMLATLRDDIRVADAWVQACERRARSAAPGYPEIQIDQLKTTLLEGQKSVLDLLVSREADPDPLISAAARAAQPLLARLLDLINGRPVERVEDVPGVPVLDLPLLALRGGSWSTDTGLSKPPGTSQDWTAALVELPDTGLDMASVALQKAAEADFSTGHVLAQALPEPRRAEIEARLATSRADRVTSLRDDLRHLRRQLVRAGISGADDDTAQAGVSVALDAVTEDKLVSLVDEALLELADPLGDLRAALATRTSIGERIEELRRIDAQRLGELLDNLSDRCADDDLARVRRHIELGQLDLAEDSLDHLTAGEHLFQPSENEDFAAFYPAGIDALAAGVDDQVLSALNEGASHPALPAEPVPEPFLAEVLNGLRGWLALRSAFSAGWTADLAFDNLLPALRLIGLEVRRNDVDFLAGKRPFPVYARGRRFLDVKASVTGKALLPAFGSSADGHYRLLIVWNEPTVEELDDWRDADGGSLPLIVCYLGTLSAEKRLRLAELWSDPFRRAATVLDDALLTWVATRRGNFAMFMRLSLPFTATQPFMSEKDSDVPSEMFYGRDQEKRRLLQRSGAPSIIYGGRGMGKSALMRTIESQASNEDFVVVWFEVDRVPGIDEDPNLLWGDLAQRLRAKGIGKSSGGDKRDSGNSVSRTVERWLQEKPARRLLLLLDEAEGFVDGDAPKFAHVRTLQNLATSTRSGCHVVLAGLHSVQHYSVGNSPLSPTGHLQIGPLGPQAAYDLVARPLSALGYLLDDDDVQRIILHCSYQPYLIQLVAGKLLSRQLSARGARRKPLAPPPWRIAPPEVADVLSDKTTRHDLRKALSLTLDLDKRTRVITNLLALHAYENAPGVRLSDADLYAKCRDTWPAGFQDTEFDAFLQLLDELAGLGILSESTAGSEGRTVRNETVLRALGSKEDMTRELNLVPKFGLPVRQARESYRPVRKDDVGRSPLVNAQLAQLFKKGNFARLVVGSDATGIDQVAATLQEVRPQLVDLDLVDMRTLGEFKSKLETGATDTRRSLVVGDLRLNTPPDACQRAFEYALGDQAGVGIPHERAASRTAALIAGTTNVRWLARIAASPDLEAHVMPLQRYDRYTLPLRWRGDPVLERVVNESFEERALTLTGGWPLLVEQLVQDVVTGKQGALSADAALERLREAQADPEWCQAFLQQTGADCAGLPEMKPVITVLAEYDGSCALEDLAALVESRPSDVEVLARVARWLGLLSATSQGEFALAPLISDCLRIVHSTA